MPFKSAEARKQYMREYLAKYRQGVRVGEERAGTAVEERTRKARAKAVAAGKKLWALEHRAWKSAQQRERRRLARAAELAGLLDGLGAAPAAVGSSVAGVAGAQKPAGDRGEGKTSRGGGGLSGAPGGRGRAGTGRTPTGNTSKRRKTP